LHFLVDVLEPVDFLVLLKKLLFVLFEGFLVVVVEETLFVNFLFDEGELLLVVEDDFFLFDVFLGDDLEFVDGLLELDAKLLRLLEFVSVQVS
jgi:hypothetical protein